MKSSFRAIILLSLCIMLLGPAYGYPGSQAPNGQQPPWMNNGLTVETGCTCHGGAAPSTEVVVSISGIPRSYDLNHQYNFTISLQHASYLEGGFLIWDYGAGTFEAGEGSEIIDASVDENNTGGLGHAMPGNDWNFNWTSPSEDIGDVEFSLVGNAIDGNGQANENDAWNILTFSISAPDSTAVDEEGELELRTISVGDYDALFVSEKDPEVLEAERQEALSHEYFKWGNIYFWSTLSILIVAAVIQGEFYERRFGGGPKHLDMSLALPQGIIRGTLTAGLLIGFAWSWDSHQSWGVLLLLGMLTAWSAYGVYRTILQATTPPADIDLV